MANHLIDETSPYLIQHAENPVDWYPWGEQALTLSRNQDKPILLSIGYSACHWCHVMAHESFEDETIAALMNEHFINIKVDREERPDIDQIYQTAHSMLSQRSGGWPLTVFLTPKQEPYFTGTYFPKTARYQLPGFADLLPRVAQYYHERKADVALQNSQLMTAFSRTIPPASNLLKANETTLAFAFNALESAFDFDHGGFGSAPKFPNPSDINFLLHQAKVGNKRAENMALQMLSAMADGGIYDQIGGGFCRYSVDERWNIPHFEKMLYDNGQLLFLYADAWQISKDARYAQIVEETVQWMQREMLSLHGAFYSSLDADSPDAQDHLAEGAFYVWQTNEVRALLTPAEFVLASHVYAFDRVANFEDPHSQIEAWHAYIAVVPTEEEQALLSGARTKLFTAREKRSRPGCDDKILTSWNALAVKGLARAGRVFNQPDWITLAQSSVDFIKNNLWQYEKLLATCKAQASGHYSAHLNAYLDDYAFLLDALIELLQADYRSEDMVFAEHLAEALLTDFEAEEGGFYFTSHAHEKLIHRPKQAYDNATPSGNGIAAIALQRLGHLLEKPRYLQAAERTLRAFDDHLQRNPAACANLCHALYECLTPPVVVILRGEAKRMLAWKQVINQHYLPHHLIICLDESAAELPQTLQRNYTEDVNAWVCKGVVCAPSVNDVQQLLKNL
ncbi:MAG: thioredoxin domain-containing protein [Methylophilaceae bacterium]